MRWADGPVQYAPPPPAKKGGGCLKWVFFLLLGSFALCCCIMTAVVETAEDPLDWRAVVPSTSAADLGTALIPGTLPPERAHRYEWRQAFDALGLGYGISEEEHQRVRDAFAALAREFRYHNGAGNQFTWSPPAQCRSEEWACVFDTMVRDSAEDIAPLTELFRRRQQERQLDALEVTQLVVAFVQNITYRLPTEDDAAFGMLTPVTVVADGSGDCDSKALLSVLVLRQLGVDAQMLLASGLGHAALGVALPVPGKKFKLGAKKYAFVEVTQPGWGVGVVPPQWDVAKAWKVIPVQVP